MDVNEVDYIKIGQRIRAARLKLGWQQAEVAFRAGLTTSHMSHIETGQTKVALPTIVKIANTFPEGNRPLSQGCVANMGNIDFGMTARFISGSRLLHTQRKEVMAHDERKLGISPWRYLLR